MQLLLGICVLVAIRGNHLASACCQQPSLLQSQLAGGISTLNVLDFYLKLSGLGGQGQRVAFHGLCVPLVAWMLVLYSGCGRAGRTALRSVHGATSPLSWSGDLSKAHVWLAGHVLPCPAVVVAAWDRRAP